MERATIQKVREVSNLTEVAQAAPRERMLTQNFGKMVAYIVLSTSLLQLKERLQQLIVNVVRIFYLLNNMTNNKLNKSNSVQRNYIAYIYCKCTYLNSCQEI